MAFRHLVDVGAVRGARLVFHGPAANDELQLPICHKLYSQH